MFFSKDFDGIQGEKRLVIAATVFGIAFISLLLFYEFPIFYKKPKAWILDRYSLLYFIFLIFTLPSIAWIVFLFWRHKFGTFNVLLKIAIKGLVLLIILEIGGQIYTVFNPGYEVLWMHPHKRLGWTFPPNSEYFYTGRYWYAREFSAHNKTNSMGFRDVEHSVTKAKGTVRIALIGDSMISARQVSFDKTAGQLLEKRLNTALSPRTGKSYEVLNFGIDGFSTTQSILSYIDYASIYKPDYVFLLYFHIHLWRTVSHRDCWVLSILKVGGSSEINSENNCLLVRPFIDFKIKNSWNLLKVFDYENFYSFLDQLKIRQLKGEKNIFPIKWNDYENLIKKQSESVSHEKIDYIAKRLKYDSVINLPEDINKFNKARIDTIKKRFKGDFIRKHNRGIFVVTLFKGWIDYLKEFQSKHQPQFSEVERLFEFPVLKGRISTKQTEPRARTALLLEYLLFVALTNIGTLGEKIKKDNGRFILVDGINNLGKYYRRSGGAQYVLKTLSRTLKLFTTIQGIDYLSLSNRLDAANRQGVETIFNYENHFTEAGNRIFQETLFDYITVEENRS